MNLDKYIKSHPGVTLTFPFNEDVYVYKVLDKMFVLTDEDFKSISLKNTPDKNYFLRSTFEEIKPGYHLNKEHWITIENPQNLDENLLIELIDDSYNIVVSKMTKKAQLQLSEK